MARSTRRVRAATRSELRTSAAVDSAAADRRTHRAAPDGAADPIPSPRRPADIDRLPVIRESRSPRPNWREDCEAVGFSFHSMDGVYWDESHCYRFTADEIDELEAATRDLHQLSLAAVEYIVTDDRFEQLAIAPGFADRIRASWKARDPALAGRFDLALNGRDPPKLLEYNADTPTALLEASVVQW